MRALAALRMVCVGGLDGGGDVGNMVIMVA
jgi:hypothetical protein